MATSESEFTFFFEGKPRFESNEIFRIPKLVSSSIVSYFSHRVSRTFSIRLTGRLILKSQFKTRMRKKKERKRKKKQKLALR